MYLIDTNILVSELLSKYEQDDLTVKYRALYQELPLKKRIISDFILNEFEIYMTRVVPSRYEGEKYTGKQQMKMITSRYIREIINTCTLMSPSVRVIKNASELYERFLDSHYISLTDSLLLAVAAQNELTLLTKDSRLINRAKELRIPCVEP